MILGAALYPACLRLKTQRSRGSARMAAATLDRGSNKPTKTRPLLVNLLFVVNKWSGWMIPAQFNLTV